MDHVLLVTVQGRPWREARAHASPVTATRQEFGPPAPSGERERKRGRSMHARSAACRDCGRSMLRFDARTIFGRRSGPDGESGGGRDKKTLRSAHTCTAIDSFNCTNGSKIIRCYSDNASFFIYNDFDRRRVIVVDLSNLCMTVHGGRRSKPHKSSCSLCSFIAKHQAT
jgi:hypothetical protein